jgi:hypothetical protein
MKGSHKEPVFNIELDHQLRHLIMKRGHLIRGQRTRTVFVTTKTAAKSWLEAKLITGPGEAQSSNWDQAHELAVKIERELHTQVYVEPAAKSGRYNSLVFASQSQEEVPQSQPAAFSPAPGVSDSASSFARHLSPFQTAASPFQNMPTLSVPDPMAHLTGMIQTQSQSVRRHPKLKCSALYNIPKWEGLSVNEQMMFETESAQLIDEGLAGYPSRGTPDEDSPNIEMLFKHPNISRKLKRFLTEFAIV